MNVQNQVEFDRLATTDPEPELTDHDVSCSLQDAAVILGNDVSNNTPNDRLIEARAIIIGAKDHLDERLQFA